MSLAFPLTLANFWDQMPISTLALDCPAQVETAGTGGGQILTREIAPRLWRGVVTLGRLTPTEAADVLPLIDLVSGPGASFMVHDLTRPYPALDPNGDVLGPSTVSISAISADRRELRLSGLPPHYLFSRGDLVGVTWGAGPVRYGMHRMAVASPADVTGLTGWIEVTPEIHPAVTIASLAVLRRPPFKAVFLPGSVQAGTLRRGLVEGIGFSFMQTLR